MAVDLRHVAQRSGVSVSTASRALSGSNSAEDAGEADMELYDLRVTVEAIEGRSVCITRTTRRSMRSSDLS